MLQTKVSMPHPVLGVPGDFTEGNFNTKFQIKSNRQFKAYEFSDLQVDISNKFLHDLFVSKKADFVLKVSCTPTYKTWTFINPTSVSIPENEVDLLLEVESFLVAKENIDDYFDPTFSDDFGKKLFKIEKRDILALTGPHKIPIRKQDEKVSLGSIFRFAKIPTDAEIQELHFDLDGDQITIFYPISTSTFDPVTLLFDKVQGLPYTALNFYIVPALTEAFALIESGDTTCKDNKWFTILDSILPEDEREENPFINAQKAIRTGLPVNLAFDEITKLKNL